jgi:MerR family copper efflux transcriptional regulator
LAHVAELRGQIEALTAMCGTLEGLAGACRGDQRPECPILRDLETGGRNEAPRVALEAP